MGWTDRLIQLALPLLPRPLVWTVARRYVAGEELADALATIEACHAAGFGTILDVLGEGVETAAEAEQAAAEYRRALAVLAERPPSGGTELPAVTISVKPTHLGAAIDVDVCSRLLDALCVEAGAAGRRVRLEMEDAPTIDSTLEVFRRLRPRHAHLGCVLQSRLFRTAGDVEALLADGPGLDVRLVKGIYLEPASIAWTEPDDISRSYVELAERLVAGGAFVGFATHDDAVADACAAIVERAGHASGPPWSRPYEFQLLMGVRKGEARRLAGLGHPVRIYVPYGRDWYAYSMRRLSRNPEIARHVLKALVKGD